MTKEKNPEVLHASPMLFIKVSLAAASVPQNAVCRQQCLHTEIARVPAKSMTGIVEEAIMVAVGIVFFFFLERILLLPFGFMSSRGSAGEWLIKARGKAREGRTVRVPGGGSRYPAESHLMLHVTVDYRFSDRWAKIENRNPIILIDNYLHYICEGK